MKGLVWPIQINFFGREKDQLTTIVKEKCTTGTNVRKRLSATQGPRGEALLA